MNKYKNLINNSLLFAVGNLGSKLLGFIMIPFYTRVLSQSDFGTTDFINTIVSLFIPIATLSIYDAVFRFAMDKNNDATKVLSNGVFVSGIAILFGIILFPFLYKINNSMYIFLLVYLGSITSMLQEYTRSIGRVRQFALTGILITITTVTANIFLLFIFNLELEGYLISLVIGQAIAILYLSLVNGIFSVISMKLVDKSIIRKMLLYSIPLIPNAFSWWLTSASSRMFVTMFIGFGANAIFAVANKIPSLISVFYSIFMQAWQMSAVEEFTDKKDEKFYSNIFNITLRVLLVGLSLLLVFDKVIVRLLAPDSYFSAWQIIPWLGLSVVYMSLSSFLGTIYIAALRTKGILITTIVGAAANVLLNITLIPYIGIQGAAISSAISFLLVTSFRLRDTKKYVNLKLDTIFIIIAHFIIMIQILLLFIQSNYSNALNILLSIIMVAMNLKYMISKFRENREIRNG